MRIIKNKGIANFVSGIIVQIINSVYGLIIPGLIIRSYGSVINGLLNSTTQFVAYLMLVEAGLSSASLVALYEPIAKKDYDEINGILAAIQKFYIQTTKIFSVGALIIALVYPFLIKDNVSKITVIELIVVVAVSSVINYLFCAKYKAFLQANNDIFVVNYTHIVGLIVQIILACGCIYFNFSIVFIKGAVVAGNLLENVILCVYCSHKYTYLDSKTIPKHNSIKQRKDILIHQIAGLIVNNTDIVVLTVFANSLSAVSVYSIYNMVYMMLFGCINSLMSSFDAHIGQKLAIKKGDLTDYISYVEYVMGIFVFWAFISMAVMIMPFVRIYTRGITDQDYDVIQIGLLFSIMGLTRSYRLPYSSLISCSGRFTETRIIAILESVINIGISIPACITMGIPGVIVGTIASYSIRTIYTYVYCYRHIVKFNVSLTLFRFMRNFALSVIIVTLSYSFIISGNPSNYLQFCFQAFGVGILVGGIIIIFNGISEPKMFIGIVKKLAKRTVS